LAKSIILGRYEEALKLALQALPYDRAPQKGKALLRALGDSGPLLSCYARGHTPLVDYPACRPDDFSEAPWLASARAQ
jgi:hypothetical protein